jgi:hypothetical protein
MAQRTNTQGYEVNANGEKQVFPYDEASNQTMRNARGLNPADQSLGAQLVREVAQSIRAHRDSYREGHTAECRPELHRGLCH